MPEEQRVRIIRLPRHKGESAEQESGCKEQPAIIGGSGNVVSLANSSNSGIIANQLSMTVKAPMQPKMNPPTGSIAADLKKRNYVLHLIERYIKFKSRDTGPSRFKPVIHSAIKREFGAKWDMIPAENFEGLVDYLQSRIDGTILGKINGSKGHKNYSTYSEFLESRHMTED